MWRMQLSPSVSSLAHWPLRPWNWLSAYKSTRQILFECCITPKACQQRPIGTRITPCLLPSSRFRHRKDGQLLYVEKPAQQASQSRHSQPPAALHRSRKNEPTSIEQTINALCFRNTRQWDLPKGNKCHRELLLRHTPASLARWLERRWE
jgi:hypothetical protein